MRILEKILIIFGQCNLCKNQEKIISSNIELRELTRLSSPAILNRTLVDKFMFRIKIYDVNIYNIIYEIYIKEIVRIDQNFETVAQGKRK